MLAKAHLQFLTSAPHVAGSPEDHRNAEYVLDKYKAAGLDAYIQPYKIWMGLPLDIRVDVVAPEGVVMHGPSPERVSDDPFQKDPRILPAFNEYSPSGDVTAEVVYANYGRPEDFKKLKEMGIDVKGKIVICRYGEVFRGVKPSIASQYGAAGVIHLLRPLGRWLLQGRQVSQRPVAARHRRAARIGAISVQISRRSHNAGHRFRSRSAGRQAHASGQGDRPAAAFPLRRCPTPTRRPSCKTSAGRSRRAVGKARCLSPITSGLGR